MSSEELNKRIQAVNKDAANKDAAKMWRDVERRHMGQLCFLMAG